VYDRTKTISTSQTSGYPYYEWVQGNTKRLLKIINNPQVRLKKPIELTVEHLKDGVLVYETLTNMYGFGENLSDAEVNYSEVLVDYYLDLEGNRSILSEHLLNCLRMVRSFIESTSSMN